MTQNTVFGLLFSFEEDLYRVGIEDSFDEKNLDKFKEFRSDFKHCVDTLRNRNTKDLVDELNQNKTSLEAGIKKLQGTIDDIENQISFLSAFNNVLQTVGKIVKVVA